MSDCTCRTSWSTAGPPFFCRLTRDPNCPRHGNHVPFDPLANARAAMRYLRDRYGYGQVGR